MVSLNSMEEFYNLPKTKWDIRQPLIFNSSEEAIQTGGLDLIIVPGLGFSLDGKRIGYGKGYYDNYLRRLNSIYPSKAYTIGICLKEQIFSDIPIQEHDITIDEIITSNN